MQGEVAACRTPPGAGETFTALMLPALSSISTADELRPLAERLHARVKCVLREWPGFGAPAAGRLTPAVLDAFLDGVLDDLAGPLVAISAGHGAAYLVRAARRHPGRLAGLVLVAPTWRGPLPTMMGASRPAICHAVRTALETPRIGSLLYGLNVSRPVVGWMVREHVYADPARVTPGLLEAKQAVTRRPRARFGTAAFVTGGLDPAASRAEFLSWFGDGLPPCLMLRPRGAPARSAAEMDALAAAGSVESRPVDGALAPHEEHPDEVAAAVLSWLPPRPSCPGCRRGADVQVSVAGDLNT